jgi:hypothetical protein
MTRTDEEILLEILAEIFKKTNGTEARGLKVLRI